MKIPKPKDQRVEGKKKGTRPIGIGYAAIA